MRGDVAKTPGKGSRAQKRNQLDTFGPKVAKKM